MSIWNPKDDLLLKNAVEAGASLESLAKGAIQFSRRYSYTELQDRWHSLLYDPDVSKVASIGMSELELSGTCPTTKSIKSEHYKEHKDLPEIRKKRNIRKQYYAMKKKSRIEFFSSTDLLFYHESHNYGPNSREHHDDTYIPNDLGLQEDDLALLRKVFPETITDYASSSDFRDKTISTGNGCQNGITSNEFTREFSYSIQEHERDSPTVPAKCYDNSLGIRNSVPKFRECAAVKRPGPGQVLLGKRLPRSSEEKQLSTSESCHDNSRSISGLRGSQNVTSPSSEGNSFLQVIGFPSPQPDFPLWNNMDDCLGPSIPVCIMDQDTSHVAATMHPDDVTGKGESVSEFNIEHSVPFVAVEESNTKFMNSSVVSHSDFVDISESLLNLANEDELPFIGANQQDAVDKTLTDYLPSSVQEESKVECEPAILSVEEPKEEVSNCMPPTMFNTIASCAQNEQTIVCHLDNNAPATVIDENVASISGTSTEIREPDCSVICCKLNTEDLEIPCNDDIFLLIHPSSTFSSSPPFSQDALGMTSTAIGSARVLNEPSEKKENLDSLQWQPNLRSSFSQAMNLGNRYLDSVAKSKSFDNGVPPISASKAPAISGHYRSSNGFTDGLLGDNFSGTQVEGTLATSEEMPFCAEGHLLIEQVPQQAINSAASDPEESQSDDDVPCTSDVETMILEMDLDPPEENSISLQDRLSGRVRYLSEETKRTVMRLEQCTQSVLRRTLASQGAFAILYGRHLKHYIKKTVVVIGRSTDDADVDIDLRKERRAKKLSRRQAIIKLAADGSFCLKNIGKSVISVNGKHAVAGQALMLSSGCLIEISRMSFLFEINKKCVQRYINLNARNTEHDKFDWSSEEIS